MGGGGHHHGTPKVPDYKIYQIENIPELMQLKRALAAQGLKDPWIRNEVWRFDRKIRGTTAHIFKKTLLRGCGVGFGLAVITTAAVAGYERFTGDGHKDHGHGHH